jgi:hypothetical protein
MQAEKALHEAASTGLGDIVPKANNPLAITAAAPN